MAKSKTVIITVGIPGSGKTTWSKGKVKEDPSFVRVNRDDFRFMLKNAPFLENKGELLINGLVKESVRKSLLGGFNVIIDATHVKKTYINDMVKDLNDLANIEFKLFDTDIDTCIERDLRRDREVGEKVIRAMWENLELLKGDFDFKPIKQHKKSIPDYTRDWIEGLPSAIIFDVDGTLAHFGDRRGPFDWKSVEVDAVDDIISRQFKMHKKYGDTIIVVSGRDESCKEETLAWLKKYGMFPDEIFMRPKGDYRKDSLIKKEIYENHLKGKYNIVLIYDDRDQVVKVWRDLGLKCLQVEYGEF